jgi:hypothetical protein
MKTTTIIIILLSGSLCIVSVLFAIVATNLNNKKCKVNTNINECNTTFNDSNNNTSNKNNTINYKDQYDVFENIDLLNKYDILDNFNDRINIYALDLDDCFNICEYTKSCLGFIRFHNYCYLKNNSTINDRTISKDMNLFYRKN